MKRVLLLIPLLGLAAMSSVTNLRAGQPTSIVAKCVRHKEENLKEGKCPKCAEESNRAQGKLDNKN